MPPRKANTYRGAKRNYWRAHDKGPWPSVWYRPEAKVEYQLPRSIRARIRWLNRHRDVAWAYEQLMKLVEVFR